MPSVADLYIQVQVIDNLTVGQTGYESRRRWIPGAATSGKREDITLPANTFTALTVPVGSKALGLILGTAINLVLKGITGDTGIALVPATGALQIDLWMPLGTTPSIGILNNAGVSQTITAIWL